MKKLISILILITMSISAFAVTYTLQKDDGNLSLAWYGVAFRAVKYYTSDTCTLNSVQWGRYTKRVEIDTIFVYQDNAGLPGSVLYKKVLNVNTNKLLSVVNDTVTDTVLLSGNFWIGIQARTQDTPSSALSYFISDTIGDGSSYYSADGITWTQNTVGDYTIRAVVSGPAGMITLKHDDSSVYDTHYEDSDISLSSIILTKSSNLKISFSSSSPAPYSIKVFDRSGRLVTALHEGYSIQGLNSFDWDLKDSKGNKCSSGIYFISVDSNGRSENKRIMIF